MTPGSRSNAGTLPGPAWFVGLVGFAVVLVGVSVALPNLWQTLPRPWGDLLRGPGLLGQAIVVAVLLALAAEAISASSARSAIRRFTVDDLEGWPGRAWATAVDGAPNAGPEREAAIAGWSQKARQMFAWRWRVYLLLAIGPALCGFLAALRLFTERTEPTGPPSEYLALLWLGSAECLLLGLLVVLVQRSWSSGVFDAWTVRATELDPMLRPQPIPEPTEPTPAVAVDASPTQPRRRLPGVVQ